MLALCKRGMLWLGICLFFPLLGVWVSGWDLSPFLAFPPVVRDIGQIGLSTTVCIAYWTGIVGLFTWLLWRRGTLTIETSDGRRSKFPLWGWFGVVWLGMAWCLA
jgi:hypothetical protein